MPTRILIADDNSTFRRALRRLLEKSGTWDITEAEDGQQAVSKALELRPDMIVLDLAMPSKDGLTAAREISAALPQTPLLMLTMHKSPQVEVEAQKVGIRRVLSKSDSSLLIPATQELLAAVIATGVPDTIPPPVLAAIPPAVPDTIPPLGLVAVPVAPPAVVQPADNTLAAELPVVPPDPKSAA